MKNNGGARLAARSGLGMDVSPETELLETMTMATHSKNSAGMRPATWGDAVMAGIGSIDEALDRGRLLTRRRVRRVAPPRQYTPRLVRATRARFGASQDLFATFFGAKPVTVQMWEQGRRRPSPTARRLMDLMNRDPDYFRRQFAQPIERLTPSPSRSHATSAPWA